MYRVEIAFGHCRPDGSPLPAEWIAATEGRVLKEFSQAFQGGQLQYHIHIGSYLTATGNLLLEPSTSVLAYTSEVDAHLLSRLRVLANEVAAELERERVMLAVVRLEGWLDWLGPALEDSDKAEALVPRLLRDSEPFAEQVKEQALLEEPVEV